MVLRRRHSVPLILCNYDGFYDGLIKFFKSCDTNGTLAAPELKDIILADSNDEVTPALEVAAQLVPREDLFRGPASAATSYGPQCACAHADTAY